MVYEVMFRVELNTGRMCSVDVDLLLSIEHTRGPSMIAAEVPKSEQNMSLLYIHYNRYRCCALPYNTVNSIISTETDRKLNYCILSYSRMSVDGMLFTKLNESTIVFQRSAL